MLTILLWIVYGFIVGTIAKFIDRGPNPMKFTSTVIIGIVGSYIGGFVNFLIGTGPAFSRSGIVMGVVGAIIFCWIYRNWQLNRFIKLEMMKMQSMSQKED